MKILTIMTLILTSSISFAANEVDRCLEEKQTVTREPIIREMR